MLEIILHFNLIPEQLKLLQQNRVYSLQAVYNRVCELYPIYSQITVIKFHEMLIKNEITNVKELSDKSN